VLGTIAGDDTVVLISRDPSGGGSLASRLLALARLSDENSQPIAAEESP
jgi:transcriptional regulator of arginine metabolism